MTSAANPIRVAHTIPSRFIFIGIASVEMGQLPAQKILLWWLTGNTRVFFGSECKSFSLRSLSIKGNILKKPRSHVEESSTLFPDGVPPHPPRVPASPGYRVRCASGSTEASPQCCLALRGASPHFECALEESMKIILSFLLAAALICAAAPSSYAEPRQVIQGTQVDLTLLSGISSAVSRDGDPFFAIVAEPVYLGTQLLLPAGTRVNGVIGTVEKARHFSLFRGQAYMNLTLRSIEVDSRLIPVRMSIVTIEQPHGQADGKRRKDLKIEEGQVVQQKHDVKAA